jgi:hypothetical protein
MNVENVDTSGRLEKSGESHPLVPDVIRKTSITSQRKNGRKREEGKEDEDAEEKKDGKR